MAIPGFYNFSKGALASLILLTCAAAQANDPAEQVFFSSGGPAQGGNAQSVPSVSAPVVSAPVDTRSQTFFSSGGPRTGGVANPYPQTNLMQPALTPPVPQPPAVEPVALTEPLPAPVSAPAPTVATAPAEPEPVALPDPALFTQQNKMGEQTPEHSFSLFGFGGAKVKSAATAPAENGAMAANAPAATEPPLPDPALFTQQSKIGEQTPEHTFSLFGAAPAATPVPETNTAAVPADGNTTAAAQQTQQPPNVPNSDLFTQTPKQGEESLEHPFKLF